jgi:ribonuclease HII
LFTYSIDNELYYIGLTKIAGCDEVGRGCQFGPVVCASVILPYNHKIKGIKDSKKLTPKRRGELAQEIYEQALDLVICEASNKAIDQLGIGFTTRQCIKNCVLGLKVKPNIVIIDGNYTFEDSLSLPYPHISIIKGDNNSDNIGAASIVAKVYRDSMMEKLDEEYPQYGFKNHKGYGTKEHFEALMKYGPTPLHRLSFAINGINIGSLKKEKGNAD